MGKLCISRGWLRLTPIILFKKVIINFLKFALCSLARPVPTTTQVQHASACIGETIFLPSFIPVSALANSGDVQVTWSRVHGSTIVPANNGVTAANYSYKLVNVTLSDHGQYLAEVTVPSQTTVSGPSVVLTVGEKPGKFPESVWKFPCLHEHVFMVLT